MKSPEDFTPPQWKTYITNALKRETGDKPNPFLYKFFHMKVQGALGNMFDPYMLAIGIDLLALECKDAREEPLLEGMSDIRLLKSMFALPRSRAFWRAVWFSRYAVTEHQIGYYRYWLKQYGYAYDRRDHPRSKKLMEECKQRLSEAEQMIRSEEPKVSFKIHWLRENMS